jgi:hypothetical protein
MALSTTDTAVRPKLLALRRANARHWAVSSAVAGGATNAPTQKTREVTTSKAFNIRQPFLRAVPAAADEVA